MEKTKPTVFTVGFVKFLSNQVNDIDDRSNHRIDSGGDQRSKGILALSGDTDAVIGELLFLMILRHGAESRPTGVEQVGNAVAEDIEGALMGREDQSCIAQEQNT